MRLLSSSIFSLVQSAAESAQIAHCLPGLVRPGGGGVHPVRQSVGSAPQILLRLVQQIPQTVQGIQQLPHLPLVIEQPHFRLQLTGDARPRPSGPECRRSWHSRPDIRTARPTMPPML